jgi:hypothetical protein
VSRTEHEPGDKTTEGLEHQGAFVHPFTTAAVTIPQFHQPTLDVAQAAISER